MPTKTIEKNTKSVNTVNPFEGFEGKEKSAAKPFAQILNPPNMEADDIRELDRPYGIAITTDNAEAVGFRATDKWSLVKITVGGQKTDAYVTKNPRFVTVIKSVIEVEKGELSSDGKSVSNWRYVGPAYSGNYVKGGNNATEYGLFAFDSKKKEYRSYTRNLVFFLDDNNEALHDVPLSLKTRAVYGATHGTELRELHNEFTAVFEATTGKKPDYEFFSYVIMDTVLDFEKKASNAPSTVIVERKAPSNDSEVIGTSEVVTRKSGSSGGRKVTLTYVPVSELMVSKGSTTGQKIAECRTQYSDFAKPPGGANETVQSQPFQASGYLSGEGIEVQGDNVLLTFVTNDGDYRVNFTSEEYAAIEMALNTKYVIKGTVLDGLVSPTFFTLEQ